MLFKYQKIHSGMKLIRMSSICSSTQYERGMHLTIGCTDASYGRPDLLSDDILVIKI
jgi:hypothetical protein